MGTSILGVWVGLWVGEFLRLREEGSQPPGSFFFFPPCFIFGVVDWSLSLSLSLSLAVHMHTHSLYTRTRISHTLSGRLLPFPKETLSFLSVLLLPPPAAAA